MYTRRLHHEIEYVIESLRSVLGQYTWYNPAMRTLIFIIVISLLIILFLWKFKLIIALGPVIGALISIIAVLGNDAIKHYSSTSPLRLSLGIGRNDPGLDIKPLSNIMGDCNGFRVVAVISNDGNIIIKNA